MSAKTAIALLVNFCCIAMLLSACQSSKIAYGNSHYFKATPKSSVVAAEKPEIATASIEEVKSPAPSVSVEKSKAAIEEKIASLQVRKERVEQAQASVDQATAPAAKRTFRKQRRSERRAFRQDLKQLTREIRQAPEEVQKEYLSSNGRLGLILAAIGLVLLLVVPGQVGYILGTILLVVGILLLILDLV